MDCQHEDPIMPDEQIAALERQHAHLRSQFASIGEMRSGSLTERFRPCGKPRCHGRIPDFPVTRSHPPASWPSRCKQFHLPDL